MLSAFCKQWFSTVGGAGQACPDLTNFAASTLRANAAKFPPDGTSAMMAP